MTDAEREEIKTLIRETVREMAKEVADLMWNTTVSSTPWQGKVLTDTGDSLLAMLPVPSRIEPPEVRTWGEIADAVWTDSPRSN